MRQEVKKVANFNDHQGADEADKLQDNVRVKLPKQRLFVPFLLYRLGRDGQTSRSC